MTKIDTPANDFVEIIDHKESLVGRYLVVRELGMSHCGPIKDVRLTTKQLIITLDWRYISHPTGATQTWYPTEDTPYDYGMDLDKTNIRFAREEGGPIDIIVEHAWTGKILPAGELQLKKPTLEP